MAKIICATRGGEASYRTQEAAIALAKEHDCEIVFLYIVDLGFLDRTAAPIVVDVENELDNMGNFFLIIAKEKATEQNIIAHTMTRQGSVREEIIKTAIEEDAKFVVLGRPIGDESEFQAANMEAFAKQIVAETNAEVIIV